MIAFRSEMESFMEVGQGPNWGCRAVEKKIMNACFMSFRTNPFHKVHVRLFAYY
jgi:hypothetical protein